MLSQIACTSSFTSPIHQNEGTVRCTGLPLGRLGNTNLFNSRNTVFVRNFLRLLANYNFNLPKSFYGSDNVAIHVRFNEMPYFELELILF